MKFFKLGSAAFAGLLSLCASQPGVAQISFWGEERPVPSLMMAPTQVVMNLPMPVSSGNLQALLAQASNGGGLAAVKQRAVRKYSEHLLLQMEGHLVEYLTEEEVPLVSQDAALTLNKQLDLRIVKHLSAIQPGQGFDLEQGEIGLDGELILALAGPDGSVLHEQRISVDRLNIISNYQVKTPHDGAPVEDNVEAAIMDTLTELAEELAEEMEDALEADSLRDLTAA